jgi:hypothetical protein
MDLDTTPARAIRRLARDIDGFDADGVAPDGTRLKRARLHTYGELTPTGVSQLIAATRLSPNDRFFDLGSGVGKVVVQVAMQVPGARCTGIELDSERHRGAQRLLRAALAEGLVAKRQVTLRHASMLEAKLTGATILFANSTCFPAPLLALLAERVAGLAPPLIFVSLQPLARKQARLFEPARTLRCATSWDRANEMHVYRRTEFAT